MNGSLSGIGNPAALKPVAVDGYGKAGAPALDPYKIRADFPILHTQVHGRPLIYLDNAATTQKPRAVIDSLQKYYLEENSNIHRGVHYLSERATFAYEEARRTVQKFLNASRSEEIIFTRGTTEGINLVANSYGRKFLCDGDEILITCLEHHSNIVPWQLLAESSGLKVKAAPLDGRGQVILEEFERLLNPKTRIVAVAHVSNALGTINPVRRMAELAHQHGAVILIDGAQSAAHLPVNVRDLDCDFYVFSGHKVCGPTGIGVLYGRLELLDKMPPYQGGGGMISTVSIEKTTYARPPERFEAGTPHIAGAIVLATALEYLQGLGLERIAEYERRLLRAAEDKVRRIPGLRIIGTAEEKAAILSFFLDSIHPHDLGTILDREGVAIRAGHHCAQPAMRHFEVPATARASFSFYNTFEEIDALCSGIVKAKEIFG
jgi:cysteine desulfurase/selenocysteine lyase